MVAAPADEGDHGDALYASSTPRSCLPCLQIAADRLDFVDEFRECFHFSLVVPPGRTFFPILGAVCRPFLDCPYALYRRLELCTEENRVFANSVERAAAAKSGDAKPTGPAAIIIVMPRDLG